MGMKAVIMAGGEGRRLKAVTGDLPKPMVPLLGKPLMERTVELLRENGITDICATLGYNPAPILSHFGGGEDFGVHLSWRIEDKPLGTAGGVKNCMDFIGSEPFLVLSGDAACDFDLRRLAEEHGFVNARKRDSQDICFVPDGDYAAFIRRRTGRTYPEGDFVDTTGRILGRHRGIIHYTIGQRRGLGVSGGRPLYVKEIRPADNTVVLADEHQLYALTAIARDFNWIAWEAPAAPIRVQARARYHQPEQDATAFVLPDGRVQVTFDRPQRALTKGQAIVLYQADVVIGGGTIEEIQET